MTCVLSTSWEPPSPFDGLRVRTTVGLGSFKILILSLSKDEDFHPDRARTQRKLSQSNEAYGLRTTAPPFITKTGFSSVVTSASGSPATAMMSP